MPETRIIRVNLEPLVATVLAALPHRSDRMRIVRGLGAAAMHYWKKLAQEQLRSTSRDYIAGLNHNEGEGKVEVTLDGMVPNMVEQGMDKFDMRDTLLKGPNVKYGKDGQPYNTVPFRHGTPGSGGRNVGRPMPRAIHQAARKLLPQLTRPGAPVSTHGGVTTIHGKRLHPGLPIGAKARAILNTREKDWHKSSIYTGMIRKGKHVAGGKIQTTGYMTFRRISRNSDPRAWKHPGIKARELAKQVQDHVASMVADIVGTATGSAG